MRWLTEHPAQERSRWLSRRERMELSEGPQIPQRADNAEKNKAWRDIMLPRETKRSLGLCVSGEENYDRQQREDVREDLGPVHGELLDRSICLAEGISLQEELGLIAPLRFEEAV